MKAGDVVAVCEKSKDVAIMKETAGKSGVPSWLELNVEKLEAKVLQNPSREAIDYEIKEQLIIEFYSR